VRRAALEQVLELEQAPALALLAAEEVAERQRAPAWPGQVLPVVGLAAVRGQPALAPVAPWPVEQAAAASERQAQVHPAGLAGPERHLPEQPAAVSD
jgi:hypothetical protein